MDINHLQIFFPMLILAFYLVINLVALGVYGADKLAARQGRWRTRESTLLALTGVGGFAGGLLAMLLFRHKTRKPLFWVVNLLSAAVHLFLVSVILIH